MKYHVEVRSMKSEVMNLCPNGSITYLGDATGWVPPNR